MKLHNSWIVVLVACLVVAGTAQAQERVSLDLPAASLADTLARLFAETPGLHYDLPAELAATQSPAITLKDVPFDTALRSILARAHAAFAVESGRYVIKASQPTTAPQPTEAQPEQPVLLYQRNRLEIRDILGKPDTIKTMRTPGHEFWYYEDCVVEFRNCRVFNVTRPEIETLSVAAGSRVRFGSAVESVYDPVISDDVALSNAVRATPSRYKPLTLTNRGRPYLGTRVDWTGLRGVAFGGSRTSATRRGAWLGPNTASSSYFPK